jgi:hypothetical protein
MFTFLYSYLCFFNHCISILTVFILFIPWRVRLSNPSLQYNNHQSYLPPIWKHAIVFLDATPLSSACHLANPYLPEADGTRENLLSIPTSSRDRDCTCNVNCSADSIYLQVSNDEAKMTSSPRTGINPRISAQTKIKTLVWFGLGWNIALVDNFLHGNKI